MAEDVTAVLQRIIQFEMKRSNQEAVLLISNYAQMLKGNACSYLITYKLHSLHKL